MPLVHSVRLQVVTGSDSEVTLNATDGTTRTLMVPTAAVDAIGPITKVGVLDLLRSLRLIDDSVQPEAPCHSS